MSRSGGGGSGGGSGGGGSGGGGSGGGVDCAPPLPSPQLSFGGSGDGDVLSSSPPSLTGYGILSCVSKEREGGKEGKGKGAVGRGFGARIVEESTAFLRLDCIRVSQVDLSRSVCEVVAVVIIRNRTRH